MARAYGDDLRRKFLGAHDRGEGTLSGLAKSFGVSVGWAKKISAQRKRNGQAERVPYHPGRKPHADAAAQERVREWVKAQPDLTLAELKVKLKNEAEVELSVGRIWYLLRKLGLRLKKSHSMRRSGIRKRRVSSGKRSSVGLARSRRRS